MHERERWDAILDRIAQRPLMPVRELAEALRTSPATLRRDLAKLAGMGLLRRHHGAVEAAGAPGPSAALATPLYQAARGQNLRQKRDIARAAVEMCRDGDAIIVNGGTTTGQMIDFLRPRRLNILTNSLPVAEALIHGSENRIVLPGGEVYREQGLIVSPFDDDAIQHYAASKMFMSALCVGPLGVVEGDALLAQAEAKLLKRAGDLVVLADGSKFAPRGTMTVAPLSRIHTLITDAGAPPSALAMLREAGVSVVIAPQAGAAPGA